MRAFLAACLAIVVIAAGSYFALSTLQQPTGIAYTTDGARIRPQSSWRSAFPHAHVDSAPAMTGTTIPKPVGEPANDCNMRTAWQWIFVDFGNPQWEASTCSASQ